MSYCRFGEDSDVYVFGTVLNGADVIEVYTGNKSPHGVTNSIFNDKVHAALFLQALGQAGYKVPQRAIDRLLGEAEDSLELRRS